MQKKYFGEKLNEYFSTKLLLYENFFIKNYCNTSSDNAHTNSNSQYPTCTIQTT